MKNLNQMADTLKSIAHPAKLRILLLLGCKKNLSVSEIQQSIKLTQSMTSQYLLSMKTQGILSSEKKCNRVYYAIKNKKVMKVISCMVQCTKKD